MDGVGREIEQEKFWDSWIEQYLNEYLNKESVVVECGGHVGFHTVYIAQKVKWVYVFEPQLINYERLVKNCELNNVENISPFNIALYSKNCQLAVRNQPILQQDINYNSCQACSLSLYENEKGDITAKTLDSLGLPLIDLIKIDAENLDLEILKGGKETIKKYRPIIIFESGPNQERERKEWVKESDYTIKEVAGANYLAIPNKRQ